MALKFLNLQFATMAISEYSWKKKKKTDLVGIIVKICLLYIVKKCNRKQMMNCKKFLKDEREFFFSDLGIICKKKKQFLKIL